MQFHLLEDHPMHLEIADFLRLQRHRDLFATAFSPRLSSSEPSQYGDVQEEESRIDTLFDDPYMVILYNDNYHTFDEVIHQIMKAVRCGRDKAEMHTWEVHNKGRSIVYDGDLEECLRVSSVLEEIDLKTEIQTTGA